MSSRRVPRWKCAPVGILAHEYAKDLCRAGREEMLKRLVNDGWEAFMGEWRDRQGEDS